MIEISQKPLGGKKVVILGIGAHSHSVLSAPISPLPTVTTSPSPTSSRSRESWRRDLPAL
jgi:hypothetical protein